MQGEPPLIDVFRTISIPVNASSWRKFLAFLGPGYLVAVGYMDPGNWATSLAGGSKFGYALLFIALLSNIMAIILQSLCARLAIATGRDLAQACRDAYPRWTAWPLWFLAEIAVCATDLAEVIGTAIGLYLLFGIQLKIGVLITALDVFLILWLQTKGFRWIEAFIISLIGVIALCFLAQIVMADPNWGDVFRGFVPPLQIISNPDMLYLALGIIGATVMPHNLYLHSAIVQTRAYGHTLPEKREALKFATLDSTLALMFALLYHRLGGDLQTKLDVLVLHGPEALQLDADAVGAGRQVRREEAPFGVGQIGQGALPGRHGDGCARNGQVLGIRHRPARGFLGECLLGQQQQRKPDHDRCVISLTSISVQCVSPALGRAAGGTLGNRATKR